MLKKNQKEKEKEKKRKENEEREKLEKPESTKNKTNNKKQKKGIIVEDPTLVMVRGKGENKSISVVSTKKKKNTLLKKIILDERSFENKNVLPIDTDISPIIPESSTRIVKKGDQLKRRLKKKNQISLDTNFFFC